jgi:hypothetical protein
MKTACPNCQRPVFQVQNGETEPPEALLLETHPTPGPGYVFMEDRPGVGFVQAARSPTAVSYELHDCERPR